MQAAILSLILTALPAAAQHGAEHRPHASPQQRETAALSLEEAADLRAGRGMGFALPAELNGYPGPMHALELAEALGLSAMQRARMEELTRAMRAETIPLGTALIAAEHALDAAFRRGDADASAVDAAVEAAAVTRGRVRAAHLRTHLATHAALSAEQRAAYSRLRGYTP